jgi:hypothetical protein
MRFWATLKLPFFEIGGEWKGKTTPSRPVPNRKSLETQIRKKITAEQKMSSTPYEEMLKEIEQEAARRFKGALRNGEVTEIGIYGLIRAIVGNEIQQRKRP